MPVLTDLSVIRTLAKKYGFAFSKSLGQNFLINPAVPIKIAENAGIDEETVVLEIGPGIGCLTEQLCRRAKKVVAVEIDKKLLPILAETMAAHTNLEIINDDILNVDINEICRKNNAESLTVCANLPYYITTPIVMSLLESGAQISSITVMIQRELARRFCSPENTPDYGAVTAAIMYYAKPSYLFTVSSGSFFPAPKVDSAVLRLDVKPENERINVRDKKTFFRVIKAAFAMRRKTLVNNLSQEFSLEKPVAAEILRGLGIGENIRGEALHTDVFAEISNKITENEKAQTL